MVRRPILATLGLTLFCALATLNVGGYRYGVQDQSFYIPSILQALDPTLYERDAPLLGAQGVYFVFDEAIASLLAATGLSLPTLFLMLFFASLALLAGSTAAAGWSLYRSRWAVAVLVLGLTLRHRISMTAVNTLEGYLHPRMLAFAVGVTALALFLRGRSWVALGVALAAVSLHPTIAAWFLLLLGVAVLVGDPEARRPLLGIGLALAPVALWLVVDRLGDRLVIMDDTWLALLAHKSYLFSTRWPISAWVANLGTAALLASIYLYRRRLALVSPRETGLVCGCGALLLFFLVTLPFVDMGLALAVQLQIGRIFWLIDLLALASLAWLVTAPEHWPVRVQSRQLARQMAVAVVLVATVARGAYVTFIEHPDRPVIALHDTSDDWDRTMHWLTSTPSDTHVLADPAHAWRHGTSVRVAGQRDLFLEEVKDPALAIYSREIAQRVLDRVEDLGPFETLTATNATHLARKYDLDYLVTDRALALPLAYRAGQFRVYRLQPFPAAVASLVASVQ